MKSERQIKLMLNKLKQQAREAGFLKNESWYFDHVDSRISCAGINCLEWVLSDTKKGKKK